MNKRKTVKEGRNTEGMREGRRGEKAEDTRNKKKNKVKKKRELKTNNLENTVCAQFNTFGPSAPLKILEIFNLRMLNLTF
jgi:hypothetical protein